MNKGNINITVSGGHGEFGNVVQGDNNKISNATERALDDFHSNVADLLRAGKATEDQIENLKREVDLLAQSNGDRGLVDGAKVLYEKYSWAFDPLKKLFSIILL
ncbi:hypothetical protein [uncultured Paraglaciecola sp.]|jgi:hypothetical protein|uniref:hypothetical protein n=1 Tax=uncultured Paraglaciecola sp. TaxID=1765024 RepID=UPI0025F0A159|nr:hypothetical protein [uncultured Paraglaciecola sp.]